jgi:FAD/FMN-containing dehydrogenase/Fe-S oxidoreductase
MQAVPASPSIPAAVADYLAALDRAMKCDVRSDPYSRVLYSTDASLYQVLPHAVVLPRSTEELQAIVTLAAQHQVALLPRGAGTSLAGQAVNAAVVLDLSRHLDQILEINSEEAWVRVQPGVVLDDLNRALLPTGLQFGPDPASSNRATLGGMVANNATGSHSLIYGMTADHLLEASVLLNDGSRAQLGPLERAALAAKTTGREGEIYRRLTQLLDSPENQQIIRRDTPRHWRRAGGYPLDWLIDQGGSSLGVRDPRFNLAKLMCGSEGTLAVLEELKLRLVTKPAETVLAVVHFDDVRSALATVPRILETEPAAIELLDPLGLAQCRAMPQYARMLENFIEGTPEGILITEFRGDSPGELREKIARLKSHLAGTPVSALTEAWTPQQQAEVWTVRKAGLGFLMSLKGDLKPIPFIEDAAVPVEHLGDYVAQIEQFCTDLGTKISYYAHASAGCLHIRPLIDTKRASELAKLPEIAQFAVKLLRGYGGALSSEHGDGRSRSWLNEAFFGPELYGLYRQVKQAFDPENRLNPGNLVDAPPMTEGLRFGADYQVLPLEEQLDFSADHGLAGAVEMCNGAGVCRKTDGGTMCPSYMVTREEEHSTRGRANLLRAALSGALPQEELTSPRMYEAMDLCIECKACKSECPSSVDMAKLKFEFLAHYHRAHGVSLRTRLLANMAWLSRRSSGALAPLINTVLGSHPMRWLLEKTLGVSRHRRLPAFARQSFTSWFQQRGPQPAQQKKVVLFNDTWNTYNDPQVSIAATEFLEAAGFEVLLPGHYCCGRPMISKGLVDQARAAARDCIDRLAPFAEQGIPIVGLEPSCLLTLRDELLVLVPDDPRGKQVAEQAYLLEEFVAKLSAAGELDVKFRPMAEKILLHGHCHQKALSGTGPSRKALGLPGYAVEEVDSGCCGMAGAFGYEAEHYDISLAMGERRLLPAVRAAAETTTLVAAGVSCRQQITHATGRHVLHPAEVLRNALVEKLSADKAV